MATASSPAAPQRVTASFSGDGVIVGYAPGVTPAGWLYVDNGGGTATQAYFDVSVAQGLPAGTYATSLRFVTGNADGSDLDYVDVPVNYRVSGFGVSPGAIQLEAIDGSTAEAAPADARSVTISGAGNWSASSDRAWLTLTQTTGSGPGSAGFSVNHSALGIGTHVAHITVNSSGESGTVTVTLVKRAPRLQVTPVPVEFELTADSTAEALTASLQVTDELGGADASRAVTWTLDAPGVTWLSAGSTSGLSSPAASVALDLVPDGLAALPNGTHETTLTFHYTNAQTTDGVLTVPVSLRLSLPRAQRVVPHVAVLGRTQEIILRGQGLLGLQAGNVRFGDATAQSVTVLSDTAARVLPPAGLPAGAHDVDIANVAQLDLGNATLTVVAPAARPYAAFAASGTPGRVLFDSIRETAWVANITADRLEPYHYDGSQWTALATISVADLVDIALDPDGKTLHIAALDRLYTLDLDDALAAPVARLSGITGAYSFFHMAAANDGRLILSSDPPCCSGMFPHFGYDTATHQAQAFQYPIGDANALVHASLDGSAVYLSGYYVYRYDALASMLQQASGASYVMAVDRDGQRVSNQGIVYDTAFNTLGKMSPYGLFPVFGSGNQRGYGYPLSTGTPVGQNVVISDLTGTPDGSGVYPEIARVAVADEPGMGSASVFYAFGSPIAVSDDERTLFIRGQSKLVIVPLPAP